MTADREVGATYLRIGSKGHVDFTGVIVRAEALTYQSRPIERMTFSASSTHTVGTPVVAFQNPTFTTGC
jgi:hypothetical protein